MTAPTYEPGRSRAVDLIREALLKTGHEDLAAGNLAVYIARTLRNNGIKFAKGEPYPWKD